MNTTELISALKIRGAFPTSNDLFSNADFLVLLNMQMKTEIVPTMMLLSEDYFLLTKDFTITSGTVYKIPSRAIGTKLRDIQYIDGSSNISHPVRLLEEDQGSGNSGYYIFRNEIRLSDDYTSGTLRIQYFARPNELVLTTSCGQITSIDTALNNVVVSSAPASMSTGVLCDFVQNTNPYDLLDYDEAITNVSGTTITFSSLPTDLVVGDWLCLAKESPVPMVPDEIHPLLVQAALVSCLASKNDKAFDYEAKLLEKQKQDMIRMLDPRVENDSIKFRSGRLTSYFTNRWY
jgi:hypothetical protein